MRTKGEGSFLPFDQKPALKIKFDKFVDGQRFRELARLTIKVQVSSDQRKRVPDGLLSDEASKPATNRWSARCRVGWPRCGGRWPRTESDCPTLPRRVDGFAPVNSCTGCRHFLRF
jgi:hypothetical protein